MRQERTTGGPSGAFFLALDAAFYLRHPRLAFSFRRRVGYWPRQSLPRRYHEKFLWRKLFDHDPRFTALTDKLAVKAIFAERHPDIAIARVLWQGGDPAEIPDAVLAGNCVVKANHGCRYNILVQDGAVDRARLFAQARKWMRRRYGRGRAEWAYRDIAPRLFVEEMIMEDGKPVDRTWKCYVAAGELCYVYVKIGEHSGQTHHAVLDADGNAFIRVIDGNILTVPIPRPQAWEQIAGAARRIGSEFDFVRVDLYETQGRLWLSELTFYSQSGYDRMDWPEMEDLMNSRWDIRRSWFLRTPHEGWRGRYAERLRRVLDAGAQD